MKPAPSTSTITRKTPLKNLKPGRVPKAGGNTIYVGSANGGVWKSTNF
jgi:hypothetical protein